MTELKELYQFLRLMKPYGTSRELATVNVADFSRFKAHGLKFVAAFV